MLLFVHHRSCHNQHVTGRDRLATQVTIIREGNGSFRALVDVESSLSAFEHFFNSVSNYLRSLSRDWDPVEPVKAHQ